MDCPYGAMSLSPLPTTSMALLHGTSLWELDKLQKKSFSNLETLTLVGKGGTGYKDRKVSYFTDLS